MSLDLATGRLGKPVKLSGQPEAIAITPNGKTAYVTIFSSGMVTPINLSANKAGKPIKISGKPGSDAIAISPDGTTAYVANQPSSTVTPIYLATGTPEKPIRFGHGWDSGFEAIAIVP